MLWECEFVDVLPTTDFFVIQQNPAVLVTFGAPLFKNEPAQMQTELSDHSLPRDEPTHRSSPMSEFNSDEDEIQPIEHSIPDIYSTMLDPAKQTESIRTSGCNCGQERGYYKKA